MFLSKGKPKLQNSYPGKFGPELSQQTGRTSLLLQLKGLIFFIKRVSVTVLFDLIYHNTNTFLNFFRQAVSLNQ